MKPLITFALLLALSFSCAPTREYQQKNRVYPSRVMAFDVEKERFYSFDGQTLGLSSWLPEQEVKQVVVAVHGMNDHGGSFYNAGALWAKAGIATYAYDQRGFGRSANRGLWPEEELMREDIRSALKVARQRHPGVPISLVGHSMGSAAIITALGSDNAPEVDSVILSAPGLRGWGKLNAFYKFGLALAPSIWPGFVASAPEMFLVQTCSDEEAKAKSSANPLNTRDNRIDQIYGVVSLMEHAHQVAHKLPANTLLLYGARDYVIEEKFLERTGPTLPAHVRTAYYQEGYHMLLRGHEAQKVALDQLAFLQDPSARLPSNPPPLPWAPKAKSLTNKTTPTP